MNRYRIKAERTVTFEIEVEAYNQAEAEDRALATPTDKWDTKQIGYLDIFEVERMTDKIPGQKIVSLMWLRKDDVLVANKGKPTEHLLTVTDRGMTDWGTYFIAVVDKDNVEQFIKEYELKWWDLQFCD